MSRFLLALLAAAFLVGNAAAQASDALGRIKAAKSINVAYSAESLPFSFDGPDKKPTGFSVDLCKRVIAQIGRAVGIPELQVNWIPGSVSERLQLVASGKADLECANTTQTLARMATVDFSNLTFIDAGGFLVKSGAPINQIADLAGKKIAVRQNTTTEARLNDTLKKRLINATVMPIANPLDGIAMIESGQVDAYAGDKVALVGLAVQAKDPAKLALLAEELSFEPYAMAMPRNDSALRLEVNRALSQIYSSGEIETIYGQWFGKLGRPSPLVGAMYLLNAIPQ